MAIVLRGLMAATLCGFTTAVADEEPDPSLPWIEFDKKAGVNPSSPALGQFLATGTVKLPPGYKLLAVEVPYQRRGSPNPRLYRVAKADVNVKADPMTWTVKAEGLECTEYQVEAHFTALTPDGKKVMIESRDIRRVFATGPRKKAN